MKTGFTFDPLSLREKHKTRLVKSKFINASRSQIVVTPDQNFWNIYDKSCK